MAAAGSFGSIFLLVIVTEFFSAAITIIADAAVTAACTKVQISLHKLSTIGTSSRNNLVAALKPSRIGRFSCMYLVHLAF